MYNTDMKTFNCNRCHVYLGEMNSGKIKKDGVVLCHSCLEKYKMFESIASMTHNTSNTGNTKMDMPDFFNGIFNPK